MTANRESWKSYHQVNHGSANLLVETSSLTKELCLCRKMSVLYKELLGSYSENESVSRRYKITLRSLIFIVK